MNDLAIGLLITPFGTIPALVHCWPYGEIFCQIQVIRIIIKFKGYNFLNFVNLISHNQALLRGAFSQQSAVILVCMAVDRYACALYPQQYHQHSSKKVRGSICIIYFMKLTFFNKPIIKYCSTSCCDDFHFCVFIFFMMAKV